MTIRVGSDEAERKVLADAKKFGWHCLNTITRNYTYAMAQQFESDLTTLRAEHGL